MPHIKITKGHDLKISGIPDKNITYPAQYSTVAILPNDFRGVKPKLLVKEGDKVNIGSPLFFNKINPEVRWASPGCGKVKDIVYGPRRVIEKIEIELDKDQNSIDYNLTFVTAGDRPFVLLQDKDNKYSMVTNNSMNAYL